MPRGRKPKPGGESVWIPVELSLLVKALKEDDFQSAVFEFARWVGNFDKTVDSQNKPDVN